MLLKKHSLPRKLVPNFNQLLASLSYEALAYLCRYQLNYNEELSRDPADLRYMISCHVATKANGFTRAD